MYLADILVRDYLLDPSLRSAPERDRRSQDSAENRRIAPLMWCPGGTMKVHSYHHLIAWQEAVELVVEIYRAFRSFPKDELYGLISQIRRAAVSIPSNIAEGQGRLSTGEFMQFMGHVRASLFEVETQLQIALRLEYVGAEKILQLLEQMRGVGTYYQWISIPEEALATGH